MIELRNNFIMAPVKLGYSDGTGIVTNKHLQFYNRRNKNIGAIILKKRGHTVDLYEKEKLGGQFNLAPLTPHKKSMALLVPYFIL